MICLTCRSQCFGKNCGLYSCTVSSNYISQYFDCKIWNWKFQSVLLECIYIFLFLHFNPEDTWLDLARCSHWDAAQQSELISHMAGTDLLPDVWLWVYLSCCPSVSKTHTLMPQELIWGTQLLVSGGPWCHHTGCSFWQRRWTDNLALLVHQSHGVAHILLSPRPWLSALHCPGTPWSSELRRTGDQSLPHTSPSTGTLRPGLAQGVPLQGCGTGWNHHSRPLTHSHISFWTQQFSFQILPVEGLNWEQKSGGCSLYLPRSPHRTWKATRQSRSPQKCWLWSRGNPAIHSTWRSYLKKKKMY